MPATDAQLLKLAQAHQLQLLSVRDAAGIAVGRLWDRFVTGPETDPTDQFVTAAAATTTAAQGAATSAALSYVPAYVSAVTDNPASKAISAIELSQFARPRGADVSTDAVLRRSIVQFRTDLAGGVDYLRARNSAKARAVQTARTEPMLSARAAASEAMKVEPSIVGYRRVPDGGACSFCLLISTRRYLKQDLSPVHPGCGCTVAPIVGPRDPGEVLDRQLVSRLMAADPALGRRGAARDQARTIDAQVHVHGELGPTVYPEGAQFSTAP